MTVDYLIIGQGISGTWLSYFLQKENQSFCVIDNHEALASSRIAAGVINPVTGRRHVEVWLADVLFPFIKKVYKEISIAIGTSVFEQKNIIDFFPSPQMRESFLQRVAEKNSYLKDYTDENTFQSDFNFEFHCGEIKPVYTVLLEKLLPLWQQVLKNKNQFVEENFDIHKLQITSDAIRYNDITARKIIFCDGVNATNNPYFHRLPFAPNKGEAIWLDIPSLSKTFIYKKGMMLVPLADTGKWWLGSSYAWDFEHPHPTEIFRKKAESLLQNWLKIPFTILDHKASIRPATIERRPFVGFHPLFPQIGILNGLGTKGCSLAPYFARQIVDFLLFEKPIQADANISRFAGILSRSVE